MPPDLVLFYEDNFNFLSKMCLGKMRDACIDMITGARRLGARVIAAGSDATDAPEPYLRAGADLVLLGEGLDTLMAVIPRVAANPTHPAALLVAGLAGHSTLVDGSARTVRGSGPPRPFKQTVPPAWDLVDIDRYRRVWRDAHGYFSLNMASSKGLFLPLYVVRETHLGQPVPTARRQRNCRGNGAPQAQPCARSCLVRR